MGSRLFRGTVILWLFITAIAQYPNFKNGLDQIVSEIAYFVGDRR